MDDDTADINEYDLAFSFAGEDRAYVEEVKTECDKLGLSVYYDKDRRIDQWGKSFIAEQRKVYSGYKTKHFVPFISKHYFSKPIPTDEFKAALMESTKRNRYILPIKIDEAEISVEYLHSDTQYLRKSEYSPQQLAGALKYIVDSSRDSAKDVDQLLTDELDLPRLKITPRTYNPYSEAEELLEYLKRHFDKYLQSLGDEGYISHVRLNNGELFIRVIVNGKPVFALNIFFGSFSEVSLGYNFDHQSMMANAHSQNGYIEPKFNQDTGVAGFEIADGFSSDGAIVSKEEVMKFFWGKLQEKIEQEANRR